MPAMTVSCIYCHAPINLNKDQVVRKITCWAEVTPKGRIARATEPVDLRQYAHRVCHEYRGNKPPDTLF